MGEMRSLDRKQLLTMAEVMSKLKPLFPSDGLEPTMERYEGGSGDFPNSCFHYWLSAFHTPGSYGLEMINHLCSALTFETVEIVQIIQIV